MITSLTIRLKDTDRNRSWTLRAARAVVGFQYQVHLAGYPKPVATGWVAHEPSSSGLDQLLRGIMKGMGVHVLDPLDNHTVGNTSPQADKITGPLEGVKDPQALLPLTECVAAMRGPRTEHEPIPYTLQPSDIPSDNGDGSRLRAVTSPSAGVVQPGDVPTLAEVRRVMPDVVRERCEECDGEGFTVTSIDKDIGAIEEDCPSCNSEGSVDPPPKEVTPKAIERTEDDLWPHCQACKACHPPDYPDCKALLVNILPKSDHLGAVIIGDDPIGKPMSQEDRDKVQQFMDGIEIKDGKVTAVQGPEHPPEEHPGTPPPLTEEQQERFIELAMDKSTLKPDEPKPKDIDCVMCGLPLSEHKRHEACPPKPGQAKPLTHDLPAQTGPQTTSMPCEVCGSDEWDGMTCKNCLQENPNPPTVTNPISVPESSTATPTSDEGTESVPPMAPGDIISSKDGTRFKVHGVKERPSANDGGMLMVVTAYPLDRQRNLQIRHGVPLKLWNGATSNSEVNKLRQETANRMCHRLPSDRVRRNEL